MLRGEREEGRVRGGEGGGRVIEEEHAVGCRPTKEAVGADSVRVTVLIIALLFGMGHARGEPDVDREEEVGRDVGGELTRVGWGRDEPAIRADNMTRA